jgi:hypothetical protein
MAFWCFFSFLTRELDKGHRYNKNLQCRHCYVSHRHAKTCCGESVPLNTFRWTGEEFQPDPAGGVWGEPVPLTQINVGCPPGGELQPAADL